MPGIRGPWTPGWAPASLRSVRGSAEAKRLDRKSTLEWWLILILGAFFGVSLLLAFLL
ncbi:MAG: hypothetical protein V3R46_03145 [Thermoplasmata archaeon]